MEPEDAQLDKPMDQLTLLAFGECGSGKSTFLSLISRIYCKHYAGAKGVKPIQFMSAKSATAITTKVKVSTTGNMTLIDSPGMNDPDKKRTDVQIQIELINTIRTIFTSASQGITSICQCIMPDAGGRIKRSEIESMSRILLSLTSLYEDSDPEKHPKMCIIFNNVSKVNHPKAEPHVYEEDYSSDELDGEPAVKEVTFSEYIVIYKNTLMDVLREDCMTTLDDIDLKERIEKLFPDDNFYFYQMRDDKNEMALEWAQAE